MAPRTARSRRDTSRTSKSTSLPHNPVPSTPTALNPTPKLSIPADKPSSAKRKDKPKGKSNQEEEKALNSKSTSLPHNSVPPAPNSTLVRPGPAAETSNTKHIEKRKGKSKEEEEKVLPPRTICISTLLSPTDPSKLSTMPSLDASLLSSSRRRSHTTSHQTPNTTTTQSPTQKTRAPQPVDRERNIDNIVFGSLMFRSWYPSWYPKEIIGEKALNGEGKGIVVNTLYVCEKCFGYGKVVEEWVRHCRGCGRGVPGRRVYVHGAKGVWSVWEVDGGVDTIFCQNLSLFAKLFLDNKSVFFDVSGFNYFLLVHTSPRSGEQQIVGFFSKEKMSWDNNNLACILIFPPWQRKGLGSILMGVSYEISRREEILGGPEKPISDLGKKGYKRFWGAEIARWLLEVKETDKKKGRGLVSVERISKETWIHGEDCLMVLRDMGVVEKAGKGKGTVERVRIDKALVREWVEKEGLGLQRVVDTNGFTEGYGYKKAAEEEVGG